MAFSEQTLYGAKKCCDTKEAAADLSSSQYYALIDDGVDATKVNLAGGAVVIRGILQNKPEAGEQASYCYEGPSYAVLDGNTVNIPSNSFLKANASGKLELATLGTDIVVAKYTGDTTITTDDTVAPVLVTPAGGR